MRNNEPDSRRPMLPRRKPRCTYNARTFYATYGGAVHEANRRALAAYRPGVYPGKMTYFLGEQTVERLGPLHDPQQWCDLVTGGIDVHRVPSMQCGTLAEPLCRDFGPRTSPSIARCRTGSLCQPLVVFAMPQRETASRRMTTLLSVVFFLSGFASLIYQVVWQRLLTVHYGVGALSITLIVSGVHVGTRHRRGGRGISRRAGVSDASCGTSPSSCCWASSDW